MGKPKGEDRKRCLRVDFERRLKLEFRGSRVTSDELIQSEIRDLETAEPRTDSTEREALGARSRAWKKAGADLSEFLPPDPDHVARLSALGSLA